MAEVVIEEMHGTVEAPPDMPPEQPAEQPAPQPWALADYRRDMCRLQQRAARLKAD